MAVQFPDLASQQGLKELDDYLLTRSYVTGYQASRDDLAVYVALKHPVPAEFVNVSRWHSHIAALIGPSFSGAAVGVHIESEATSAATDRGLAPAAAPAPETPAATAEAPQEADDDNLDLFGEETEEEAAAAAEREAAKKAAGAKKKESGKSSVLLDVKP